MIGRCPPIEKLEALVASGESRRVENHARRCVACQGILALLVGQAPDPIATEECATAELLIASRAASPLGPDDQQLLDAHAEQCTACAELLAFAGE